MIPTDEFIVRWRFPEPSYRIMLSWNYRLEQLPLRIIFAKYFINIVNTVQNEISRLSKNDFTEKYWQIQNET